mmetsp:Transcript_6833/g.19788  ORF Transcript_6833/g.19788 Transcript_6833/m.19788 type:complete len:90 (-) Transcript_6833:3120-3389(-)
MVTLERERERERRERDTLIIVTLLAKSQLRQWSNNCTPLTNATADSRQQTTDSRQQIKTTTRSSRIDRERFDELKHRHNSNKGEADGHD